MLTLLNQLQSVTVEEVHIDLGFLGCYDLVTHYLVLFLVLLDLLLRELALLSFDYPLKSRLVIYRLLGAHYPKETLKLHVPRLKLLLLEKGAHELLIVSAAIWLWSLFLGRRRKIPHGKSPPFLD